MPPAGGFSAFSGFSGWSVAKADNPLNALNPLKTWAPSRPRPGPRVDARPDAPPAHPARHGADERERHDSAPRHAVEAVPAVEEVGQRKAGGRSEEHTSELQSR